MYVIWTEQIGQSQQCQQILEIAKSSTKWSACCWNNFRRLSRQLLCCSTYETNTDKIPPIAAWGDWIAACQRCQRCLESSDFVVP